MQVVALLISNKLLLNNAIEAKHEIIPNENETDVYYNAACQCVIHAFGSIDLWNYRLAACSFGRNAKG